MGLTDNEKREVIKLIEADTPLPDTYRFLLFGDKREVGDIFGDDTMKITEVAV